LISPNNGNSDVTSYSLYWDNSSGTPNILLVKSLTNTFTVTGLTGGNTYLFVVQATNIYGTGELS
jgi:hypothetical protein